MGNSRPIGGLATCLLMRVCFLWIGTISFAVAFSGSTISPVVVQVMEEDGGVVVGAVVTMLSPGLERIVENELDPKSEFAALARKVPREGKTDIAGAVLLYSGGGFVPDENKGNRFGLSGKIVVRAEGYDDAELEFRRSFSSEPENSTELTLKIVVTLKRSIAEKSKVPLEKALPQDR